MLKRDKFVEWGVEKSSPVLSRIRVSHETELLTCFNSSTLSSSSRLVERT